MRIIKTSGAHPTDTLGQLALYNGFDNLSLLEILPQIFDEMGPTQRAIYDFEMRLQAPLLEMEFNGVHVDVQERARLIREHEAEKTRIDNYLDQFCTAIGYYDYYLELAVQAYANATGLDPVDLPRSWSDWLALDMSTRREWKQLNPNALALYHKSLKEVGQPFNANSSDQKMVLFYHFFGTPNNAGEFGPESKVGRLFTIAEPPWLKTKGIPVYKTRRANGEYGPAADRECLEKIQKRALESEPTDAAYWAQPFLSACLYLADLNKTLQFLNCKLERGLFRTSFAAATETGRLSSKKNAQDYGWNGQNVSPKNRVIFTCPMEWKLAACDYEQIESRMVAAICYILFGATRYIHATESGDAHSLAASMVWEDLPWPADFNIKWLIAHGPFPKDMIRAAKKIAGQEFYRGKSRRDVCKTLGHGCLTGDHEVLTPNGWVPITDKPPIIMQGNGEFAFVSNWIDKEYSGWFIQWEGQTISTTMTADHRVYYTTTSDGALSVAPAVHVPKSARILLGKDRQGGTYYETKARLLAAYHCDGHWGGYNQTHFHFHKDRKIDRIKMLAAQAGISIADRADPTSIALNWVPDLHAPTWDMLNWDTDSLAAYMDELKYWDGHIGATSVSLFSKNKDWVEMWQTFNRLLGFGGNIQKPRVSGFGTTIHALQVNNRQFANRTSFKVDRLFEDQARVYCPTVPTKNFYVRRNGSIHVTGNSNYLGQPFQMSKHSHIDIGLVEHFQAVYFANFPEIKQWHNWVIEELMVKQQLTTPIFGRTRQFFGRPSDDATVREAVAYMPQSMAADLTNNALLRLHKLHIQNVFPAEPLIQKHDELIFRFKEPDEQTVMDIIIREMEKHYTITSPEGKERDWYVPAEAMVGWNLGFRKETNLDGLAKYPDSRTRTRNPFDVLSLQL